MIMKIQRLLFGAIILATSCFDVNFDNPNDPASGSFIPGEFSITEGYNTIEHGVVYDFGSVSKGGISYTAVFVISNEGLGDLNITSIEIAGDDADSFILNKGYLVNEVEGGSETRFTVEFRPVTYGNKTALITLSNSDSDENNFTFSVSGSVLEPDFSISMVWEDSTVQTGNKIELGVNHSEISSLQKEYIFTVTNNGTDSLQIYDVPKYINICGPDADRFSVLKQPRPEIEPGMSSTFIITFEPEQVEDAGITYSPASNYYAELTLNTNDPDKSIYTITVNGKGYTRQTAAALTNSDEFAASVASSNDYIIAGSPSDDGIGEATTDSGCLYIFYRNSGGINRWREKERLYPDIVTAGDQFGKSVAIDKDTVVAGAWKAHVDTNADAGAVYVFNRNEGGTGNWGQQARLVAGDPIQNSNFGCSVDIADKYLIAGAYRSYKDTTKTGAAYIFYYNGSAWIQQAKLTPDDGGIGDVFGWSVAIDGDYAVVGAYQNDSVASGSGAVYIFYRNQGEKITGVR